MLVKILCIFAALAAVQPQCDAQLEPIIQYLQLAQLAIDTYRNYKESGDGLLGYIIQNVPEYEALDEYVEYVLENYSDSLREEVVCLLRLFNEADEETQLKIHELATEVVAWYDLRKLRDEQNEFCETYTMVSAQQYCKLQVASTTTVEINQSAIRIQMLTLELGDLWIDATRCVASLVSDESDEE